jgi:hypothetical protein
LDLIYSRCRIISSGNTSQRMELLISKSGSRISGIRVVIVVTIVGVKETMLPSFYTDLVQGCNPWQISISYSRRNVHISTTGTPRICFTHGAVQLKRISKIFNRSKHDRCLLWIRQCKGMSQYLSARNFSYNPLLLKESHYIHE